MTKRNRPFTQQGPWYQTLALVLAIVVLLACKLVEEIRIEQDGSGVYRGELTLVGDEKQMLQPIKEEIAKKPALRIVKEGPRGNDYFVLIEMPFVDVAELGDKQTSYSWYVSEAGAFTGKARLVVTDRGGNEKSISAYRVEVTMPGKVVDSNAGRISGKKVVWDRLAAGPHGELYVEAEFLDLPEGYSTKITAAAGILIVGVILLVVLRLERRKS